MVVRIITCALLLAAGTLAAAADTLSACRRGASPNDQLRACANLIASKPAPDILVQAWTHRGAAFQRKGMGKEAAESFTNALKLNADHKPAWMGRGMARLIERKFADAIADYSAAIRIDPKDPATYVARGYAHLARKDPKEAVRDFSLTLRLDAGNILALNNRGLAYRKLGQTQRAIADYTKALQINPLYALAYNNRGYAYEALGKTARAINDFRDALIIDPSLTGARAALVRLSAAASIAAQNTERVAAGKAIAEKNCAWCHAVERTGKSPNKDAPAFTEIHTRHPVLSLREPISRAIATPHDKMPKLPLSRRQVDQLIAYINNLQ